MQTSEWLRQCGLPRVDALALLRDVADLSHAALLAHPETPLAEDTLLRLDALAARLHTGEPLAYVLGWREFFDLRFAVNPAVLVPRPETELLVDFVLNRLQPERRATVLDLGTGSGAIAVTVAYECPHAVVWATDASTEALIVAARNAQDLLPAVRPGGAPRLRQGDWYAALPADAPPFNLILSNPPYVAQADPHLEALRHEPLLALVGSRACADGLEDIRRIVAGAPAHLAPGGWLAIEHGYDQAEAVRALMREAGLAEEHSVPDLAGIDRVTAARMPA